MSCKKIILCSALAGVVVSISLFTVNLAYERFFEPNLTFGIYYSKAMILAWPWRAGKPRSLRTKS